MRSPCLISVACLSAFAFGKIANAQTYSLTATAETNGTPAVIDSTTAPGIVIANNAYDNGSDVNPAFSSSSSEGRPSLFRVAANAGAQSFGPSALGSAFASLNANNDLITFDATHPFTIEISLDLTRTLVTNRNVDDARVIYAADFRVLLASGGLMVINDRFRYSESLSQSANNVTADDRDAFTVDLQPGDVLDFRLSQATASATAVGSNGSPSGSAFAELNVEINIDVIAGDAQISAASSGGDYTTQPCIADLAEPLGTLNFFDVAAYIALYNASDSTADIAEPLGTLNFFDVAAYIAAYSSGCP